MLYNINSIACILNYTYHIKSNSVRFLFSPNVALIIIIIIGVRHSYLHNYKELMELIP